MFWLLTVTEDGDAMTAVAADEAQQQIAERSWRCSSGHKHNVGEYCDKAFQGVYDLSQPAQITDMVQTACSAGQFLAGAMC